MAKVTLESDALKITFSFFDRVLTLTGELNIPLAHVDGIGPGSVEMDAPRRYQMPGVWAPGTIMAGIFIDEVGRTLWDVHNIENAVAIYFTHEAYFAAVIDVDDPDAVTAAVTRAVAMHRAQ